MRKYRKYFFRFALLMFIPLLCGTFGYFFENDFWIPFCVGLIWDGALIGILGLLTILYVNSEL